MPDCICQPTGRINNAGEVRRMRWCPRCGELYSLSGSTWCTACQRHNSVDVRLVLADVVIRAVTDA